MILIISRLETQIRNLKKTVVKRNKYKPPLSRNDWYGSNLEAEFHEKTKHIEVVANKIQDSVDDLKELI